MTFLEKSYSEFSQVEKPVLVTIHHEGPNKEKELEMVPVASNNNNSVNIVSDFDSDWSEENFKNSNDNIFEDDVNDQV